MLQEYGHPVVPVHPKESTIEGLSVISKLADVPGPVDTVTVYLREAQSLPLLQAMCDLRPDRVILNPGAESEALKGNLEQAGIRVEEACTLVLLRTGQY